MKLGSRRLEEREERKENIWRIKMRKSKGKEKRNIRYETDVRKLKRKKITREGNFAKIYE